MGRPKIDMIGVQCNNWEVIGEAPIPERIKNKTTLWWTCKCLKCGRIKDFNGTEIRMNRIGECHCDYSYAKPVKQSKHNHLIVKNNHSHNIINETNNRYGKLFVKSFAYTKNSKAYWNCICDCGRETIVCGNHLRTGRIKSCGCLTSYKEEVIMNILQSKNIKFKKEYIFKDLKDKSYLRFDFAIFKKDNLFGLIEYQGCQHFESPNQFNQLGNLQKHDKMKVDYCQKNNIPLLILDKNSNLENDILNWFNRNSSDNDAMAAG